MNRELTMKVALWILPVLFGAGALYQTVLGSTADVVSVKAQIDSHEDLPAHPVTESRLDTIVTEQRAVRAEQKEQGENISAICQATGARCK